MLTTQATSSGSVSSKAHFEDNKQSLQKRTSSRQSSLAPVVSCQQNSTKRHSTDMATIKKDSTSAQRLRKRSATIMLDTQATSSGSVSSKAHFEDNKQQLDSIDSKNAFSSKVNTSGYQTTGRSLQKRTTSRQSYLAPAVSRQQHSTKRQMNSTEQRQKPSTSLKTARSHTKQRSKNMNTDSHKSENRQERVLKRHLDSKSLGITPLQLDTHNSQTEQSLTSIPQTTSTILDLCRHRNGLAFEGEILVVYGPGTNKNSNTQNKTEIVHVDLVDSNGQMTITMNISNALIDNFLPRILVGSSIRITKFIVNTKSPYERGDADCCIALTSDSTLDIVKPVCKHHKLTPDKTISQLIDADCYYSVGSFGAIATNYHINRGQLELHVKDGDLQQNMATLFVANTYTNLWAALQQLLSTMDLPLILFKNFVRTGPRGSYSIRPSQSSFVQKLNDECTKAQLQTLARCNTQILGTLKAKNPHLAPYEICCSTCHRSLTFDTTATIDSMDCPHCKKPAQPTCHHSLLCTLQRQEGTVDCTLQGDLLKQHFPHIATIPHDQYDKNISPMVYALRTLQLYATFTLTVNNTIVKIVKQ